MKVSICNIFAAAIWVTFAELASAADSTSEPSLIRSKSQTEANDDKRSLQSSSCGCSSCSFSVLDRDAGGHKVGARIDWWLEANRDMSERQACRAVCGREFPRICGRECNPDQCDGEGPRSKCDSISPDEYTLSARFGGTNHCYRIQVRNGGRLLVDTRDKGCARFNAGNTFRGVPVSRYQRTDPGGMAIYEGRWSGNIDLVQDSSLNEARFEVEGDSRKKTFSAVLTLPSCGGAPTPTPPVPTPPVPTPPVPTPTTTGGGCIGDDFFDSLKSNHGNEFNRNIFLSQTPEGNFVPSRVYKFEDFITALKNLQGVGNQFRFWVGNECDLFSRKVALVNMAAFLGQAIRETILYDVCDENNYDYWRADVPKESSSAASGFYPMSASCGQLGQVYADYDCDDACPRNAQMSMTASTNAAWFGAPPPLFCGPTSQYNGLGYWNPNLSCPNNSCEGQPFSYPGHRGGVYVPMSDDRRYPSFYYSNPLDGSAPRNPPAPTNVEGCCWWGRGVIQTTGRCNFGRLNKNLGAGSGSNGPYPNIDFCANPSAICTGPSELKWVAGVFYWVTEAQSYNRPGFNYKSDVESFVRSGCADNPDAQGCDNLFVNISGVVNRGCHNPGVGCPGSAHGVPERVTASKNALRVLMKSLGPEPPSSPTAPSPTPPSGTCGNGNVGNGRCDNGECCSRFGWCGTTDDHCNGGNPTPTPPSGTCGNGNVGNGRCDNGECCSRFGWCGTTDDHCNGGNPTPTPPSGTCGNGNVGNGRCDNGECCSRFGWCGTTDDHCNR